MKTPWDLFDSARKSMGKRGKKMTGTIEIGPPTDFQHVIHIGPNQTLPITSPSRRSPYGEDVQRPKLADVPKNPNDPFLEGSKTLPRNFRQSSCTNALPSPLDICIPKPEQKAYDSTKLYNPNRFRGSIFPEWVAPSHPSSPRPIHRTSHENSSSSLITNSDYMHTSFCSPIATTPGSNNYGTMTDFMGTTRSNVSNRKIINSNYVDQEKIDRYRSVDQNRSFEEQPRKGILKNARSDSGLNLVDEDYLITNSVHEVINRTYQHLPYKSPTPFDTSSSLGRRIRSSTKQKVNGVSSPSPLTRPYQLEMTGVRNEGTVSVVPPTVTPVAYLEEKSPLILCEMTEAKNISIFISDERPLSVRTKQEIPSAIGVDEDEEFEEIIITHL